jgi:hypothetical protein
MYGVTSRDAALVRFASTSGRSTRAALADVVAAGPDVRAFLAVSDRRIGRGLLEALDAEGDVVGEPMWTIWGGATLSKETACLCSHLHEAAGGVTPGSR